MEMILTIGAVSLLLAGCLCGLGAILNERACRARRAAAKHAREIMP